MLVRLCVRIVRIIVLYVVIKIMLYVKQKKMSKVLFHHSHVVSMLMTLFQIETRNVIDREISLEAKKGSNLLVDLKAPFTVHSTALVSG